MGGPARRRRCSNEDRSGPDGAGSGRWTREAKEVARKARGLEAALVDKMVTTISALDPVDTRSFDVAGTHA